MKTIKNAYEDLKGDLNNTFMYNGGESTLSYNPSDNKYYAGNRTTSNRDFHYICTVEEFKGYKPKSAYTQEMHEAGELPSVGMECEFETTFFTLKGLNTGTCVVIAYHADRVWLDMGKNESVINLNVIAFKPTTPPVKLVDGKAYQFDYNGKEYVGICNTTIKYKTVHVMFESPIKNTKINSEFCTNIQPLTVEK